jgi:hypothetical protein
MGDVIEVDFREARARRTANQALEKRMEAERSRAHIEQQELSAWEIAMRGLGLYLPGGIDDLDLT